MVEHPCGSRGPRSQAASRPRRPHPLRSRVPPVALRCSAGPAAPPPLPLLALKAGDIFYSMPRGEPLHFAGCNGFDTACGNWLVYRRVCDLLLVDPFSGATMTLPAQSSVHLADEDEGEDSRDGHDSADDGEDSEGGHDSADDGDDSEDSSVYTDISVKLLMDVKYSDVIKLMVCSPNLIAALFQGRESNRIAVCRPGGSMRSVAGDLSLWITDMAFYQGKLYVVDYHEDLLALDISVDDNTGDPRTMGCSDWTGHQCQSL